MARWQTVAILGVGLIGGSIGLALRARGLAERVVGIGRSPTKLAEARRLGALDEGTTELSQGVADAEVAVVCTPVDRIAQDVRAIARHGSPALLITDAGSTKQRIVADVEADERARRLFVGGHPLAGSERTGASAARPDLFDGRVCVLTPTAHTPHDRLSRTRAFWHALGSRTVEMGPRAHDDALARTSHLPHIVAATLAAVVPEKLLPLAAGAFRDGTRVAAADTALWTAIFLENRMPVIEAIGAFQDCLADVKFALITRNEQALRDFWNTARDRRHHFEALNSETSDPGD